MTAAESEDLKPSETVAEEPTVEIEPLQGTSDTVKRLPDRAASWVLGIDRWKLVIAVLLIVACVFFIGAVTGWVVRTPESQPEYAAMVQSKDKTISDLKSENQRLDSNVDSLQPYKDEYDELKAELDRRSSELDQQKAEQDSRQQELDQRSTELDSREAAVKQREDAVAQQSGSSSYSSGSTADSSGGFAYYKNCSAARAAGAAPLYRGQPGYRSALDRDGDGIACE